MYAPSCCGSNVEATTRYGPSARVSVTDSVCTSLSAYLDLATCGARGAGEPPEGARNYWRARRARTTSVLPIERLWLPLASSAFITHSPIGRRRHCAVAARRVRRAVDRRRELELRVGRHAGVFWQPPAVDASTRRWPAAFEDEGRRRGVARWRPEARQPCARGAPPPPAHDRMRSTMSTMTNQAARRGDFSTASTRSRPDRPGRRHRQGPRGVLGAGDGVPQGMPLVVDYGDCSDAPSGAVRAASSCCARPSRCRSREQRSSELSREFAAAGVPTLFERREAGGDGGRAARRPAARAGRIAAAAEAEASSKSAAAAAKPRSCTSQRAVGRAGVRRGREPARARRRTGAEVLADGDVFVSGDLSGRALRRPRHGAADRRRPLQRRARLGGGRLPARRLGARAHRPKALALGRAPRLVARHRAGRCRLRRRVDRVRVAVARGVLLNVHINSAQWWPPCP